MSLLTLKVSAQTKINAAVHSVSQNSHIEDKTLAADGDPDTRARIKAYTGVAVLGGAYSGYMELQFLEMLPANTTSYVKIAAEDNILKPLLGGTLSGLLNNLAGILLTGSQQFTIEAKDNTTTVFTGQSEVVNSFANDNLRIAQGADGSYYVVITPAAQYNRIRITNRVGAAIALGVTKRLDVYEAFYVTGNADCGIGNLTSYSGTGISLSLLELGKAGVTNANYAINTDITDKSELGLGLLGVAASVEQTVYFQGTPKPTDKYFIKLGMNPGLLTLGVANNIIVTAHNGSVQGQSMSLSSLLSLDLLGLLQAGQLVSVPFNAGTADRITIRLSGLVQVDLDQVINLYGIVKSDMNVTVAGGGTYKVNNPVSLVANVAGCSGPYTYKWSQDSSTQAINATTGTPGTATYTVTVTDRYGISAIAKAQVVVEQPPLGGTVTGGQAICPGTTPGALELTGHLGNITRWEKSATEDFAAAVTLSHATDVLPAEGIGTVYETTYYRAVVANGSYPEVYSEPAAVLIKNTTWNGSSWSNGEPDLATTIYITGNYNLAQDLYGCSLEVANNAVVSIPAGSTVTLNGALKVLSGSMTLQNNANLIQLTDVQNTGNIFVKRQTSPLYLLDYTMWSSPVTGIQTLKSFSPDTANNRFYAWNTQQDGFVSNSSSLINPLTSTFAKATGYLIRVGAYHPAFVTNAIPGTRWEGTFTGVPNNGQVTFNLTDVGEGYNLTGNPYPSPIDAVKFLNDNKDVIDGTMWIWRKKNDSTTPQHYVTINSAGVYVGNGEPNTDMDPQGVIRTGQGFLVKVKENNPHTTVAFTNAMRLHNTTNQFFRGGQLGAASLPERHGMWVNLSNDGGFISQLYVGYIAGATQEEDHGIDSRYFTGRIVALSSLINDKEYIIQGRQLPFKSNDIVPLQFKSGTAGTYTIAIDKVEGLFEHGQKVYLKDNLMGVVHDLTQSSYTFITEAGIFNSRFEVMYIEGALSVDTPVLNPDSVIVYKKDSNIMINAGTAEIAGVAIYDMRGRMIYNRKDINATEAIINNLVSQQQVLIVQITTAENGTVTKKIIF